MDHRAQRLSEAIREELSEIVAYEMSDPRVGGAVVTDVHISPDKRHAIVRVGVYGGGAAEAMAALDHARGFLRRQLAIRLEMYRIPELRFEPEPAAALGSRADFLLRRIRRGRPREDAAPTASEPRPSGSGPVTDTQSRPFEPLSPAPAPSNPAEPEKSGHSPQKEAVE
jgi:ribosome-binding factor A